MRGSRHPLSTRLACTLTRLLHLHSFAHLLAYRALCVIWEMQAR